MVVLCMAIVCHALANAQENPVGNYLQQVGNYADLYNGKMETNYNVAQYSNLPYYRSTDFTAATIVYRKIYYPNQKVRLDLYKEQLIVSTFDGRYGIILNPDNVEKVVMYDKTFRWLNPSKESGLKAGYYIHLSEGKKIQLFRKESYTLWNNLPPFHFDLNARYYLLYNNRYYTIRNKSSFSKIFSQHKKQIKQFAKNAQLNFKQYPDASLASLAGYCDELITSTNKQ